MINANQTIVKVIVLLIFLTAGTKVFSQKATFSIYTLIPEFSDSRPVKNEVKETLTQSTDLYVNPYIHPNLKEQVEERVVRNKNINSGSSYDFFLRYFYYMRNTLNSFYFMDIIENITIPMKK